MLSNGYLLVGNNGECVAIDAPDGFADWVAGKLSKEMKLTHVLITHQHFDHVYDVAKLKKATGCCVVACEPFSLQLTLSHDATLWGLPVPDVFHVDELPGDEDSTANWAGLNWQVLHVPGHSADSLVYALPDEGILFTGDVLFNGAIGRSDLPGGNKSQLLSGIRSKLMSYPPETQVLSGHGSPTTIGEEELNNSFIQG